MDILLPLEAPSSGDLILPFCRDLPGVESARIALLHVVADGAPAATEVHAEALLSQASRSFQQLGAEVATFVRRGDPAPEVVALADELSVDLIVMHVRPHAYRDREHRASVTESVLAQTHRPAVAVNDASPHPARTIYARIAFGAGTRSHGASPSSLR